MIVHVSTSFKRIYRSAHLPLCQLLSLLTTISRQFCCKLRTNDDLLVTSEFVTCYTLKTSNSFFHRTSQRNLWQLSGESDTGNTSILESSCLQHWFKNWQESRKNRLTASVFAGAIGFWRQRRVQLWLEKIGAVKPFPGNLATVWGNIKEEEALERYKLITGNTVLFPEFRAYGNMKDCEYDWLGCSADGLVDGVVYGLPYRGVLEIKCPYFGGDKKKMYPWSRVPLYFIPQAQGLMEILDRDWMDFYCWTVNGSSLFRMHRDREYWGLMKIALSDFWWENVVPAREIYRSGTIKEPLYELRKFRPASRHELCPAIVLASKCLVHDSEMRMREIHGKLQLQTALDLYQLKCDQMHDDEFMTDIRSHELRRNQMGG